MVKPTLGRLLFGPFYGISWSAALFNPLVLVRQLASGSTTLLLALDRPGAGDETDRAVRFNRETRPNPLPERGPALFAERHGVAWRRSLPAEER